MSEQTKRLRPLEPKCYECGVEMERYEDSPDTGCGGWRCPECGWSEDDEEKQP